MIKVKTSFVNFYRKKAFCLVPLRPEKVFYEILSSNENSREIRLHWTRLHVDDIHGTNLSYSIVSDDLRAFTKNCFYDLNNVRNEETRYRIYSVNEV